MITMAVSPLHEDGMRRAQMLTVRALLTVILVVWCAPLTRAAASPGIERSLKIGFVIPLSGEWAFLGNGIRDAAILARDDLQAQGRSVDLVFEDNHGDLARSAAIGARLISERRVEALVSILSGVGKVLQPVAKKAQIVHVGICSDTDVADGTYSFINYLTAEQGVKKFRAYFSTVVPQGKLAVFALNESGFDKIIHELERQPHGELTIASIERYNRGTTDFRSQLIRVKGSKPDALLLLGLSPEIELIAKQARALQWRVSLTSIEGFGLAADKAPFEGQWFIDSALPSEDFQQRFAVTYGRDSTPGVGHAYDTVMLLAHAADVRSERGGTLTQGLRAVTPYAGVIGALTVRGDGVIWSDASVKVIRAGKATTVER